MKGRKEKAEALLGHVYIQSAFQMVLNKRTERNKKKRKENTTGKRRQEMCKRLENFLDGVERF